MDIEDIIEDWASTKKFKDKTVREEDLEKIFDLTTNAPTAFNLQPYRFTVLSSEEAKNKAVNSVVPVNGWIRYADKIVVLIADEEIDVNAEKVLDKKIERQGLSKEKADNLRKMFENYKSRDKEFLTGWLTRNSIIPATFFMLACRNYGIGCCPVRGFSPEKLKKKLNLKITERPVLLFPIGYPREEERSWRRPGEQIYNIL